MEPLLSLSVYVLWMPLYQAKHKGVLSLVQLVYSSLIFNQLHLMAVSSAVGIAARYLK